MRLLIASFWMFSAFASDSQTVSCQWNGDLCTEYYKNNVYTDKEIKLFKESCTRVNNAEFRSSECKKRRLGCVIPGHDILDDSYVITNWFTHLDKSVVKDNCENAGGVFVENNSKIKSKI